MTIVYFFLFLFFCGSSCIQGMEITNDDIELSTNNFVIACSLETLCKTKKFEIANDLTALLYSIGGWNAIKAAAFVTTNFVYIKNLSDQIAKDVYGIANIIHTAIDKTNKERGWDFTCLKESIIEMAITPEPQKDLIDVIVGLKQQNIPLYLTTDGDAKQTEICLSKLKKNHQIDLNTVATGIVGYKFIMHDLKDVVEGSYYAYQPTFYATHHKKEALDYWKAVRDLVDISHHGKLIVSCDSHDAFLQAAHHSNLNIKPLRITDVDSFKPLLPKKSENI